MNITYALGKKEDGQLKSMLSTSINAQIVMAMIVALVLEIAGVWFLNNEANIPEGRMEAANWVLQCSIVTLMISLISSPFNALIIAHERMAIYAYMSVVDVTLKLAICFVIMAYGGDRLVLLVVLQVVVALSMSIFYGWYCGTNFDGRTEEEIQAVEEWINKYPRRIHGYKSAGQLFDEELKRIS